MLMLDPREPLAAAITAAIQSGNRDELEHLLAESPELATATIIRRGRRGEQARSLLRLGRLFGDRDHRPNHLHRTRESVKHPARRRPPS
jgi:hypothetical protein